MRRWERLFELGLFASVVLLHVGIALGPHEPLRGWFRSDDAFYYFKTAQNIAEGFGSTFDRVSPTNGYHPLWLILCIPIFALARTDLWIPLRVVVVVAGLLNGAGAVLLFRLVASAASGALAAVVAVFWSFWPPAHATTTQLGLENALNAFLFVLSVYLISRLPGRHPPSSRQAWPIAVVLTLLVLARLDNIFAAAFLGAWIVLSGSPYRTRVVLYAAILVFGVVAAMVARVGPERVLWFKDPMSLVLGLSLVLQLPCVLLLPKFASPSARGRLTSLIAASTAGAVLLWGAVAIARAAGLPAFPHLAVVYDWAIVTTMLVGLEAYLTWARAARPDEPAVAALRTALRRGAAPGLVIFGTLALSLAAYFTVNQLAFGTPVPVSGQVKEWWGTIYSAYGRPPNTPLAFFGLDPAREAAPIYLLSRMAGLFLDPVTSSAFPVLFVGWTIATFVLLRMSVARRLVRAYSLVPLGMANMALVLYYAVRGYQNPGEWYWIGPLVFAVLGFSVFLDPVLRWLGKVGGRWRLDYLAAAALVGVTLVGGAGYFRARFFSAEASTPVASGGGEFLETHTEPGSRIGVPGSGGMGYFLQGRTIVNLDGLANSYEYFRLSRIGQGAAYLGSIGLDYVYASPGLLSQTEPYKTTFEGRLEIVARNGGQVLYRFTSP